MTSELQQALDPVVEAMHDLGIEYRVGGSVASSRYGVARSTLDVDVVADIRVEHVERLTAALGGAYYVDAESMREAIRRRRSFNVIHIKSMIKVDIFVLKEHAFDQVAFSRPRREPLSDDDPRPYDLTAPGDLVLLKLESYRAGDGVSQRQWQDILGVLRMQRGRLDLDDMRRWAVDLEVGDLLERAIEESAED